MKALDLLNRLLHPRVAPEFDLEKAVGHYLLSLPRCSNRVEVVSRKFLDRRYNYEMTVDAAQLAAWAEKHAKGAWTNIDYEQAARLTLPMWLGLADHNDKSVTIPPKKFFELWRGYHSTFYDMPGTQLYCPECAEIVVEVFMIDIGLPPSDIFDCTRYEWHCPRGHLLYQEEIGRHASFSREKYPKLRGDIEAPDIPEFLRK